MKTLPKELFLKFYEAASMQRWNDQIRVVELTELDKQAHKMVIAYCLGKLEETAGNTELDWIEIIEAGLFEFMQRIVLTDLKPQLFHRIKEDRSQYIKLNHWVYSKMKPLIEPLGKEFCGRFGHYLLNTRRNINRRIISAAHFYATKWEFDIIERNNPSSNTMTEIKRDIAAKQEKYHDLKSMQEFIFSQKLKHFVGLCGHLRFQIRWSHLPRVPKTSVLGHMLLVAMFSYLFSLQIKASAKRCYNNYFTALFHDLPEVLTRDIINPVKRSVQGLQSLIKDYEHQEMERKIYRLLPKGWHPQIKSFTEGEFSDLSNGGQITRDGKLIKAVDELAAFIEAHLSLKYGIQNDAFKETKKTLKQAYGKKVISGVDFGSIFNEFD